jgi:DNA-binding NtrC family response regulator
MYRIYVAGEGRDMKQLRISVYPDDDPTQVRLSGSIDVPSVGSGGGMRAHGLQRARSPEVVVLDLQAARSCSCDVILEAVRRDADLSDVPIVVCSADEEFLQSRRPLLQGLHCDLLAKPCDLESLLEMIENALADQSESAPRPVKEHRVPEAVTVSPNPRSRDHGFTAQLAD